MIIRKIIYPETCMNTTSDSQQKKNFEGIKRQLKHLYYKYFCDYYFACTINIKDNNQKTIIHFRIVQNGKIECAYSYLHQNEFEIELNKIKSVFEKYYPNLYLKS